MRNVSWILVVIFLMGLIGCGKGNLPDIATGDPSLDIPQGVEIEPGIITPPPRAMVTYVGGSGE